jgi:hypothetical protein
MATAGQIFRSVALAAGLAALSGCASRGYYYGGPPPSPPRAGPTGYSPGPGFVWVDGFYDLRGSRWVWAPGYWTRPPRPRAVWVRPYWEPHNRGYRFHRGRWR